MRYPILLVAMVCLVLALTVTVVVATASGPPDHDSYIDVNEPSTTHESMDLAVEGSESSCTETRTTYLQWDLSDIPNGETVASAELTLTARFVSGTSSATLALHQTGDGWNESTLTANNAPAVGTQIETQAAPTSAGQTVTFNSAALASHIDTQAAGGDVLSLALLFSSGCPTGGTTLALFEDAESTTGGPDLQLRTAAACIPEDVNCDGAVDTDDLDDVTALWRSRVGDPDYDPDSDVNKDDVINIVDVMMVAAAMGV